MPQYTLEVGAKKIEPFPNQTVTAPATNTGVSVPIAIPSASGGQTAAAGRVARKLARILVTWKRALIILLSPIILLFIFFVAEDKVSV